MHLKLLEMVGFKSFADKTRLSFEPGMTAIVGPNGCGKSNVSDAIRWVLGEQSAKALRGSKMEDCIFNGTQNRKPLGMSEVSITFTNCESVLNTDYHDVTITRRVFRSGEGQYFINKTPCRLKDVQRLFMDTGIGTSSYSFMAQGRIDQILSARPEDRREIFEEASGITKYKSDKREALRKLEHTEANLLRLADVIREVRRQIGSLQRQAGKARRYQTLRDEMRALDLFAARHRLLDFEARRREQDARIEHLNARIREAHTAVQDADAQNVTRREAMLALERELAADMEAGVEARSRLERTQDLIRINTQRIEEYRRLAERDHRERDELDRQLADRRTMLAELEGQLTAMRAQRDTAKRALEDCVAENDRERQRLDQARDHLQKLRDEALEAEAQASRLHNERVQIESRERATLIQRERLSAEQQQLNAVTEDYTRRTDTLRQTLEHMQRDVETVAGQGQALEAQRRELQASLRETQQARATLQSAMAGQQATLELLTDTEEAQGDFPGGARLLLDPSNPLHAEPGLILGPLAEHVQVPEAYARAVETALRDVLDAIIVSHPEGARALIGAIAAARKGSARLLACPAMDPPDAPPEPPPGMTLLASVVTPSTEPGRALVANVLGRVLLVERADQIPVPVPQGFTVVTADGILVGDHGLHAFWMPEPGTNNPLRRRQGVERARAELARLEQEDTAAGRQIEDGLNRADELDRRLGDQRRQWDVSRREAAQKEGELQMVLREAKTAAGRLETVSWELKEIVARSGNWDGQKQDLTRHEDELRQRREALSGEIARRNRDLQQIEIRHRDVQGQLTERRVAFAGADHRVEQYTVQQESVTSRIAEIEDTLRGRMAGIEGYDASITQLTQAIQTAREQIGGLEHAVREHAARAEALRGKRETEATGLASAEGELGRMREQLEEQQAEKSKVEIQQTETRMRRQNLCDRVMTDYHVSLHDLMNAPEPEWGEEGPLGVEETETRVAELRTKLEAMGPVNLVAIEEYQEHEERYTFLSQQENDLQNAKRQLVEMIQNINATTSEMFRATFDQANRNFEAMFSRLFNGGSARLVLVNEEDVLDCGIEIIARPPGKRLQNISLLSGGERTLTAVALLFSIYQIKPSPFCMLDELDAPLDDSNIGRFADVLKDFLKQSQFVVITHNRQTIATSNVIYGVTMPERGVSRIMSMKFRDAQGGLLAEAEDPGAGKSPAAAIQEEPDDGA